uniref:Uncharacterized protein n=1 Tax=Sphaerodactylus townsendi TaxID=933632 RepID=A0ACB8G4X3_9SAUR
MRYRAGSINSLVCWVMAFEACDEGNKGYLSREDYKVAVVMLFGYKPSKMEADSVMASVQQNQLDSMACPDQPQEGCHLAQGMRAASPEALTESPIGVSLDAFLSLMRTKKTSQLYHSEARHLFTAFDMQCKGFLSLDDFKKAFRIVAPKLPERTIVETFRMNRAKVFLACSLIFAEKWDTEMNTD